MDELLGNIDSIMNENDRKLLDLIDNNPKTFEDLSAVSQLLQSKFQNSSALICVKFEIPHECFDIIQAEVCDWNLPKADRINTIPHIPHKLLRELLLVNNREECEEIKIFLDKFCDKPLLQ